MMFGSSYDKKGSYHLQQDFYIQNFFLSGMLMTVIIIGNGCGEMGSNPVQGCLHLG